MVEKNSVSGVETFSMGTNFIHKFSNTVVNFAKVLALVFESSTSCSGRIQ